MLAFDTRWRPEGKRSCPTAGKKRVLEKRYQRTHENVPQGPPTVAFRGMGAAVAGDAVVGAALEVLVGILAGARIRLANLVCIAFDDI